MLRPSISWLAGLFLSSCLPPLTALWLEGDMISYNRGLNSQCLVSSSAERLLWRAETWLPVPRPRLLVYTDGQGEGKEGTGKRQLLGFPLVRSPLFFWV